MPAPVRAPLSRKAFLAAVGVGAIAATGAAGCAGRGPDPAPRGDDGRRPSLPVTEDVRRAGAAVKPQNKIVRTICCFTDAPSGATTARLDALAAKLGSAGYAVQTKRLCSKDGDIARLTEQITDPNISLNVGTITFESALAQLPAFYRHENVNFAVDLTDATLDARHAEFIFRIIRERPSHTFNYSFVFNNPPSSPFFPAARYERDGFSVGLEPTDLAEQATSVEAWLLAMRACWHEIDELFGAEPDFLGIDASTAPFGTGKGSLLNFVKRLGHGFDRSTTTGLYTTITKTLTSKNPRPVGLNGLMFPCLEDFELAAEYEAGRFPLERCLFLSLHSGVGIDTYPIGIDEDPRRVLEVLQVTQALSNKHRKPLAVRFASDGRARIGERTAHTSPYLTNCTVRAL